VGLGLPAPILLAFPLLLSVIWILRSPVVGFYALFAAALLISVQPMGFEDSLTDNIPFFLNLSDGASLNVSGLGVTPAEILMVITFVGLIATDRAAQKSLPAGRLMTPYLVFGVVVAIGEVNGLIHGGDFKKSLWELRPQVYGLAMFVMATLLIRSRSQLKILLAILFVAEAYKGGVGVYRYFVTLDRTVGGTAAIQSHEESYLLGLFVVAVVIGLIWFRRQRLVFFLLAVTPVIITAILVNHRRAATGALALEIVIVMVLAYVLEPRFRRSLVKAAVVMVVVYVALLAAFWNQQSGIAAELVRPTKSIIDPTARDVSSDLYRVAESANLKVTFRTSPLLGIGFGHPYYIIYPQTGVAKYDPLWNIIPHNTVLWIPMRMGIIGVIAFWCLISLAIIEAIWMARAVHDNFIRGAVVLAMAAIVGVLFTGYYDVGLENYRNLIVLGVMLAIINRAADLARDNQGLNEKVAQEKVSSPGPNGA
jgi:O-antigen ligase